MIYIYDKTQLIHRRINLIKTAGVLLTIVATASAISYYVGRKDSINGITEYERVTVLSKSDAFSKEKLATMLKQLNVKFPYIVMAQSIIETGHWKSHIFIENHNLFGMKEAKQRITTASGTESNHAFYDHWRSSVYDYAFYQSSYLKDINSEAAYFEYLGASYAEATGYVQVVKETIERENLKALFN